MANKTLKARLITNSALASAWTSSNPVLLKGEIGIENDTRKFKFGDGVTAWNSLPYVMPEDMGDMLLSQFATNSKADEGYVDKAIIADDATKLKNARTISLTGDMTGSTTFDGSANKSISTTLKNSGVSAGTYPKVTVDAKGIVTGGANLSASDIPSIPNSKVTGLGTAATKNTGTSAGQVPILNSAGKLDENILPALAITDSVAVASQAAMLALDVQRGDIAIRTDLNKTFILSGNDPSVLGNWLELRTPTDAVLSVAGKTGAVTLSSADLTNSSEIVLSTDTLILDGGTHA